MRNCKAGKAFLRVPCRHAPASPATPAPASPQAAPATMRAASDFGRQQEHARVTPAATLVTCEDSRSKDDLRERSDGVGKWLGPSSGSGSNSPARGTGTGTGAGGAGWTPPATPLRRVEVSNARARGRVGVRGRVCSGARGKIRWPRVTRYARCARCGRAGTSCARGGGEPPGGPA